MGGSTAGKPKLNRRQVQHVQFCEHMRRKYAIKATAARMGLSPQALRNYINGKSMALEDWQWSRKCRGFDSGATGLDRGYGI